jgi:hypothetical protein
MDNNIMEMKLDNYEENIKAIKSLLTFLPEDDAARLGFLRGVLIKYLML